MSKEITNNYHNNYRGQLPGFRFWLVIWDIWNLGFVFCPKDSFGGIYLFFGTWVLEFSIIIAAIRSTIETRFSSKVRNRL